MITFKRASLSIIIFIFVFSFSNAQEFNEPWWPSKYGEGDTLGAANLLTPGKVLEANKLITEGRIFQLGRLYEKDMPKGGRTYKMVMEGNPSDGPFGKNRAIGMSEMIVGELGQVGTQFDGLGHFGARIDGEDRFYNGFKRTDIVSQYGIEKLGVENIGPIYTRGILLDMAGFLKKDILPPGYVISTDEIKGFLKQHNLKIHSGDVVLIRTGHGKLWKIDNEAYMNGEPGIGLESAQWLADQGVVLIGADNFAIEAVPFEDDGVFFPVHLQNIAKNGIYHIEHMDLEELASEKVYEFAFVFVPVPFKGASGSPGNPIAIK